MTDHTKRTFLKTSVLGAFGLMFGLPSAADAAKKANTNHGYLRSDEPLNWEAFIDFINKKVKKFDDKRVSENKYVQQVAALCEKLDLKHPYLAEAAGNYQDYRKEKPEFTALLHRQYNFEIYLLSFEKGEAFEPHDHPEMTGVTHCVTGEIHTQSYEVYEENKENGLLLRKVEDTVLTKRNSGTLTSTSKNIHRIEGRSFAQLIDVFTPSYNNTNRAAAKNYTINEKAFDEKKQLYNAEII